MTPFIKICGLSTASTLDAALAAGADRVGLVFFPNSPRAVTLVSARRLAAQARGRAEIVALVVDADDALLDAVLEAAAPDFLQLHGRETPARVAGVRARTGRPVIKALAVSQAGNLATVPAYAEAADILLFDAKPPKGSTRPGGNGASFDWTLLRALDLSLPFMLSGGLTPANVAAALAVTRAPWLDVSSGVETAPGVKDAGLMAAFVRAARAEAASGQAPGPDDDKESSPW